MDFHLIRRELRRLGVKNLYEMVMNQKESKCILNGLCSFYFKYRGYGFCLSEVLGKGCELQKPEELQMKICHNDETLNSSLLLSIFNDNIRLTLKAASKNVIPAKAGIHKLLT